MGYRGPVPLLSEMEKMEAELWFRYQELDEQTQELKDTGQDSLYYETKKNALRAHGRHQRCLNKILVSERKRLFALAKYSED